MQTFRLMEHYMFGSGFNYGTSGFHLRHGGEANVSFADGHVAAHGRESLVSWGIKGHVDQYGNRIIH